MLTNNFYCLLWGAAYNENIGKFNPIAENGAACGYVSEGYIPNLFRGLNYKGASSIYYWYIKVGTGTTAPTKNDYCLENDITDSLTLISGSVLKPTDNRTLKIINATFKNDTDASITVNEIAAFGCVTGTEYVMMDRYVLDTSVTIAAGEIYTFSTVLSC